MAGRPLLPAALAMLAVLAGCAGPADEPAEAAAAVSPSDSVGLWIGPVRLCRDSVESASAVLDADGSRALLVRLAPEARRRFARWTEAQVGRTMAIRLDGRILSEPRINEPILGGMAQISGVDSDVEAAARAAEGRC